MTNCAIKKGGVLLLVCFCFFLFAPISVGAVERELKGSFVWYGIKWDELIRTGYTQDDGKVIWGSGNTITIIPENYFFTWFNGNVYSMWGIQSETSASFKKMKNQSVEATFIDVPGGFGRLYIDEDINSMTEERWRADLGSSSEVFVIFWYWMKGSGTEMEWQFLGEQVIGPRTSGEHTMGFFLKNNSEVYYQLDGTEGRVEFGGVPLEMHRIDRVTLTAVATNITFTRCEMQANNRK